ncbi:MAG: radical SAM protein, partial [Myxococcota bacterium]|nr:radical SAM protein [Myxococcota bacterium]
MADGDTLWVMVDPTPTLDDLPPDPLHPARVAARIARWAKQGIQGPLTLEVYPTLRCNLDCVFCDTTERHRPPVDELSAERWLEIIDEAHALGVERVFVLGGGEPLARRDVTPALLRRVKQHGMQGVLTTNGTLLGPTLATQLVETGWDEIHFSIDGPTPALHDRLRGQPGAFKKTVQAACNLAVRKRREERDAPRIALHFVLMNQNWRTLPDMIRLADSLGAFRVDFDTLIAYTPEQQALRLSADEQARVPEVAAEARALADMYGIATTLDHFLQPERLERGSVPPAAPNRPGLHGAPCLKAWHY